MRSVSIGCALKTRCNNILSHNCTTWRYPRYTETPMPHGACLRCLRVQPRRRTRFCKGNERQRRQRNCRLSLHRGFTILYSIYTRTYIFSRCERRPAKSPSPIQAGTAATPVLIPSHRTSLVRFIKPLSLVYFVLSSTSLSAVVLDAVCRFLLRVKLYESLTPVSDSRQFCYFTNHNSRSISILQSDDEKSRDSE